jgi:hypothetical protein
MENDPQIYPPADIEQQVDEELTETYGPSRENVNSGLKWLFNKRYPACPSYLDHPEYRIKNKKRTMIGRPYGLQLDDLKALVELAHKKEINVSIYTPSNYNYKTVLVIITEWKPGELWEVHINEKRGQKV